MLRFTQHDITHSADRAGGTGMSIAEELVTPGLQNVTAEDLAGDLLISGDSHIFEPSDLWRERLPEAFRDRAPYSERGNQHRANSTTAGFSQEARGAFRPGGWDPSKRVEE